MNKYLKEHLSKYPKMQIEDKIKLIMQGYLGNGHLINDYKKVLNRITNEYESLKNNSINYDLIEKISDNYSRVYLKPYFEKYHSFDLLIEKFIESSKEKKETILFLEELEKLKEFLNNEEKEFLEKYIKEGNYLISHSDIYRTEYHPHYLVINNKYLEGVE